MFKRIVIHLTGPICSCEEQSLQWAIEPLEGGKSALRISCKTCGTKLVVPHTRFVAGFDLENKYPKNKVTPLPQPEDKKPARVLHLVPSGDTDDKK